MLSLKGHPALMHYQLWKPMDTNAHIWQPIYPDILRLRSSIAQTEEMSLYKYLIECG
jgi:hypothetical protein